MLGRTRFCIIGTFVVFCFVLKEKLMTVKTDRLQLIALIASTEDEQLIAELKETAERRKVLQYFIEPTRDYVSVDELAQEQSYDLQKALSTRGALDIDIAEYSELLRLMEE